MGFRFVPKSATLNDLERRNDRQRALSLQYRKKRLNNRTVHCELCYGSVRYCMDWCASPDRMCFWWLSLTGRIFV